MCASNRDISTIRPQTFLLFEVNKSFLFLFSTGSCLWKQFPHQFHKAPCCPVAEVAVSWWERIAAQSRLNVEADEQATGTNPGFTGLISAVRMTGAETAPRRALCGRVGGRTALRAPCVLLTQPPQAVRRSGADEDEIKQRCAPPSARARL